MIEVTLLAPSGQSIESPYSGIEYRLFMLAGVYHQSQYNPSMLEDLASLGAGESELAIIVPFLKKAKTYSIAQHFSGCVRYLIDGINTRCHQDIAFANATCHISRLSFEHEPDIKKLSDTYQLTLLFGFLTFLSVHPSFKQGDNNHPIFEQLNELNDRLDTQGLTGTNVYKVISLLNQFKIDGVDYLDIKSTETHHQQRLDAINFPGTAIPKQFICHLSEQVMDTPCQVTNTAVVDYRQFITLSSQPDAREHYIHPYTRASFELADMGDYPVDFSLKNDIARFVAKICWLSDTCPNTASGALFTQHKINILDGELTLDDFRATLTTTSLHRGFLMDKKKTHLPQNKADYEHLIRQTAASGDQHKLQSLLEHDMFHRLKIDVNAVGSQGVNGKPSSQRTALHQVVIFGTQQNEKLSAYQACYDVLIAHQADTTQLDKDGKSPLDYDCSGHFSKPKPGKGGP